jgi:septal ring factor EnvC (AmiA/AmiB activator)
MRKLVTGWCAALSFLLLAHGAYAKDADASSRQTQAEHDQTELRERIKVLQKEIESRESSRKEAADALKASESEISVSNRRLRELNTQLKQAQTELDSLQVQIRRQQSVMHTRRDELSEQLRKQYASGLSPWTALLSGDDPQKLGRNLAYLDFIARSRADAVTALKKEIERLAELQTHADQRKQEIAQVVRETTEQKNLLEAQKKERATILARLEGQLQAQRAEAARLERDEKRLTHLIDELTTQIETARRAAETARRAEEQRRAEQAKRAAEARQQQELKRQQEAAAASLAAREAATAARQAQADQQAQAQAQSRQAELEASQARQAASEAARQAREAEATSRKAQAASNETSTPSGAGLKAGLRWPVRGSVMARFGTDRPEGGVWRGILVRADEGSTVSSVGAGTVVYSSWLRGFGNLLIVDHGQEYLSVYAYNQSLLKQVGDAVKAGEAVSMVGNTGGQLDSALYFEIRHRGAAVDPISLLAR